MEIANAFYYNIFKGSQQPSACLGFHSKTNQISGSPWTTLLSCICPTNKEERKHPRWLTICRASHRKNAAPGECTEEKPLSKKPIQHNGMAQQEETKRMRHWFT